MINPCPDCSLDTRGLCCTCDGEGEIELVCAACLSAPPVTSYDGEAVCAECWHYNQWDLQPAEVAAELTSTREAARRRWLHLQSLARFEAWWYGKTRAAHRFHRANDYYRRADRAWDVYLEIDEALCELVAC
jgi:hypothetical protein